MAVTVGRNAALVAALAGRLDPGDPVAQSNLAWFAGRSGDLEQARAAARLAASLPHAPPAAWHNLEQLALGRRDDLILAGGRSGNTDRMVGGATPLAAAVAAHRQGAQAVAEAVRGIDDSLWLYALAGSRLVRAGRAAGLRAAPEAFAERRYAADGQLAPRDLDGAVIDALDPALAQVRALLRDGTIAAIDGSRVLIEAETLCLHGDRPNAAAFARGLRAALEAEGVTVAAAGR